MGPEFGQMRDWLYCVMSSEDIATRIIPELPKAGFLGWHKDEEAML